MAPSSRMAEYRRHVQARRAPVVATVTTPEADAACARCGVRSFADLLRPFADVVGLNVPMRHNAEAPPYALSELSIRFHGVRECRRAAPETAEAYARRAFEPWDGTDDAALARTLDAVPRETREIVAAARARVDKSASATFTPRGFFGDGLELERKRRSCEGEDEANLVSWFGTPWFDRFAGRNARRCAFSDFETADHPRALVFATALPVEPPGRDPGIEDDDGKGSEPSPSGEDASNESTHAVTDAVTASLIETFSRMSAPPRFNPDAYPESIRRGTADPDVAAHFVVLHDAELAGGVVETRLRSVSEALASVMRERRLKGGDGSNERDASFDERIAVTALPILRRETSDASDDALAAFFAASAEARLVGDEAPGDESSSLTLTDDDVETLRAFVRVFATETLLPHMERRLAALNRTVASTRKGLKNQLKTFWGRNVAAAGGLGFAGGFGGSFGSSSANGSGGSVAGNSPNVGFLGDGSSNATASVGTALKEGGGVDASAEEETRYASRSPAFEIRLAADLAFSLRDFETAAHHLRLLQSDFKADKAYRHLACAHESLAEALACQTSASSVGGRGSAGSGLDAAARREIDAAFDAAVAAHRRCAPMASASETSAWTWRVSHSRAVFLASAGAHRDAALALATASGDENLSHHCAASALEAAAFEFLRAAPPAPRKFAMHAVLAGHRFAQAGFRAHAVRCYASALPVYETRLPAVPSRDFSDVAASADEGASFFPDGTRVKTPWARAREHLHFALGRQITKCGGLSAGAAHFEKLLRCADGVSPAAQATYLREFLFVDGARENARRDDSPSEIPEPDATRAFAKKAYGASLPEIDASDVVVSHEPHGRPRDANAVANAASNGSDDSDADDVPEETWRALESDGVVPARLAVAGAGGATWLDAPGAGSRGKKEIGGEQFGVCAAGETVFVETRFRNPLAIPIHLTDVSLRCAFEAPNETKGDEGLETKGSSATLDDDSSYVSTPALAMTLRPLETRLARLKCVPRREGTLRVLGVSWRLRENGETGETKKGDSAANDKEIDSEGTQQRFPNFVPFDVRAARSRRGADGVSWIRDAPRERRLALRVTPAMPRLECRVLNAPASAPAGAVAKITLVARNVATSGGSSTSSGTAEGRGGATAALRARVRAPGEGLVALADVAERDARGDASGAEPTDPGGRGGFVFEPAGWRAVAPGEEVSVDLYVRLPQVGVATLPFVVCYEPPEPAPPSLRFRVARVAAKIVATPSLAVAARVSDAAAHPAAKTLRLAVRNVSGADGSSPGYAFRVRAVRLLAAASVPKTPSSKEARTRDEPKKKTREETRASSSFSPRRDDVFLRPAAFVPSKPEADTSAENARLRGLAVDPATSRALVLTAGPAEAFATETRATNASAGDRDPNEDEGEDEAFFSDVVSYVGDADAADAADAAERVAALARLLRASSAAAAAADATPRRDASRRETSRAACLSADAAAGRAVAVEWEATAVGAPGEQKKAETFFGAHFFAAPAATKPWVTDRPPIRWTMDGPPSGASTIETRRMTLGSRSSPSVSARFALRVHNHSPDAARVTFESTQFASRAATNFSRSAGDETRDSRTHDETAVSAPGDGSHGGWAVTARGSNLSETGTENGRAATISSLPPGPPWLWTGPVTRSAAVPSGATATLDLVATAFAPGVHAMGEYRLIVERLGGGGASRVVARPSDASDAPFAWTVREA